MLILLLLSLIWVTWVARILAAHWARQRGAALTAPPASGEDEVRADPWWGSMESLEPMAAPTPEGVTAGTIEAIDPVGLSLVLHTDDAQLKYVLLPEAAMLDGLTHGDRIVLCLNAAGRPWLLRKVEPGFKEVLDRLAGAAPAAAPRMSLAPVRQGGMQRLAS